MNRRKAKKKSEVLIRREIPEDKLIRVITQLEAKISDLERRMNGMTEVIKADFKAGRYHESVTQHLISEFGFDVPERLRPRR